MSEEGPLSDPQKAFLQFLWRKGICAQEELEEYFAKICEAYQIKGDLSSYTIKINRSLEPLSFALLSGRRVEDASVYWAIVNVKNDSIAEKFASSWSRPQISFFKAILDKLLDSNQKNISRKKLLKLAGEVEDPKIKRSEAEEYLENFKIEGWLDEDEGECSFSVRTFFELKPFFDAAEFETGFEF